MQLPAENQGMVLIERGAVLPAWLHVSGLQFVEQQQGEGYSEFCVRGCLELDQSPTCTHVVVVLAADSHFCGANGLEQLSQNLVAILSTRTNPRMLLCVPPETTERKRKALLALVRDLAQGKTTPGAVLVGAHFSARPPQSETLPVQRVPPKRGLAKVN